MNRYRAPSKKKRNKVSALKWGNSLNVGLSLLFSPNPKESNIAALTVWNLRSVDKAKTKGGCDFSLTWYTSSSIHTVTVRLIFFCKGFSSGLRGYRLRLSGYSYTDHLTGPSITHDPKLEINHSAAVITMQFRCVELDIRCSTIIDFLIWLAPLLVIPY